MRRAGPLLAAVVVLLANAVALVGVARNRTGEPEAEVLLTERELPFSLSTDQNTGIFLRLDWQRSLPGSKIETPWFDRAKLESLGFDCSHPVEEKDAREHYRRMVIRRAYVVLEYDGAAWARWLEAHEAQPKGKNAPPEGARVSASRLVPVDVGLDAAALRALYPDRSRCLIVPAIVAPRWNEAGPDGTPVLSGHIRHVLVSEVHVPKHLGAPLAAFRTADAATRAPRVEDRPGPPAPRRRHAPPRYEVLLRYGTHHQPWVADVRPLP